MTVLDPPAGGPDLVHCWPTWPPPQITQRWIAWLRRHGIDPARVPVPGWVERRPDHYQVAVLAWTPNENGRPYFDARTREVAREVLVVQLEGPPLPFPDETITRPAWEDEP